MAQKNIFLAIISGLLLALSFPNFNIWAFAWIALIPLLFAIDNTNLLQSFGLGWLAGFVMFIGQIFWLKIFHVSVPLFLTAYLALYFGIFCLLYQYLRSKTLFPDLLLIPIIWVAIEYLRSIGLWGFPAGVLAYSQYQNLLFIQIADVVGVFGVSFLIVLVNACLFSLLREFSSKRAIKILSALAGIFIIVLVYGGVRLAGAQADPTFRLALIQPGFDYSQQYEINQVLATLNKLTAEAAPKKPDLIVWPETVLRQSIRLDFGLSKKINALVNKHGAYLVLGNPDVTNVAGKIKRYNSAFFISPAGQVVAQYNKVHPVPFWEVMPVRHYLSFLKNTEAKGTCDAGQEFTVFDHPKAKFSVLICFEGIFSDLTRRFVRSGAQFLVNISNDSWSQSLAEHWQHASMNVFRAIENRIYYVRLGNSGASFVIDPYGRFTAALPIYQEGYLATDIGLRQGQTVYSQFGDYFGYLSLAGTAGLVLLGLARKG